MQSLHYNSNQPDKNSTLAEESWKYFSQFLSRYQWAFDEPGNSPRKTEIAHAILNRGNKGCCTFLRPDGYKYILPLLHPRFFEQAINRHRKVYYVSYGKQALLYFDIDLHYDYQTWDDGEKAKTLIDGLFQEVFGKSVLFWSPSQRGLNGYLKVDLQGERYSQTNELFARLEKALQLFLAHKENLADFEIKGRIGYLDHDDYHWAQYGKLPLHSPGWDFNKLAEFQKTPTVRLRGLRTLCYQLEWQIPASLLTRHKLYKKALGTKPFSDGKYFRITPQMEEDLVEKYGEDWHRNFLVFLEDDKYWIPQRYYRPGNLPCTLNEYKNPSDNQPENLITKVSEQLQANDFQEEDQVKSTVNAILERVIEPGKDPKKNIIHQPHANSGIPDLLSEPDSFKRQHEALRRLARYLKRIPTQEEAMDFLKIKNLYSGNWEDKLVRRNNRVRDILNFIALTFDPGKCAKGSVNIGKYDTWSQKAFPHGLTGQLRGGINEYMEAYPGADVHVSHSFIAVFMAVAEFALLIDKNQDHSLPHKRAEELWTALYTVGLVSVKFDSRKWAICRDQLEKFGIIQIIDRNYCSGQAMKWSVGSYFPFMGLWKKTKGTSLKVLSIRRKRTTEQHNTLLQSQSFPSSIYWSFGHSRSPPSVINSS